MAKSKNGTPATATPRRVEQLTYALTAYTAQRRQGAWLITPSWSAFAGEKPEWRGPFETIEEACQIIGSLVQSEMRRRHAAHIESYRLKPGDPLYGLRPNKAAGRKRTTANA